MKIASVQILLTLCLGLGLGLGLAACVPIPLRIYVPEAPDGRIVYSSCAYNKHVPNGMEFTINKVKATVSIQRLENRQFIELIFEAPADYIVQMKSDRVDYVHGPARNRATALFNEIGLVANPILARHRNIPNIASRVQPVFDPIAGATFPNKVTDATSFPHRNFWLATYIDVSPADEVWVTLPAFTVNGVNTLLPEIHFRQEHLLGVALMNC
jgi:hypothetical protein